MAFTREQNVTVAGFEDVSITLFVPGASNIEGEQTAEIEIQLKLSDGKVKTRVDNLAERLAEEPDGLTHLNNLLLLRDYILARIPTEVLPT